MASARLSFAVEGMLCGRCASTVQERLCQEPGVREAVVNFKTGRATVVIDDERTTVAQLIRALREVGYDSSKARVSFEVNQMYHSVAGSLIERSLARIRGVLQARANPVTGVVVAEYLPGMTTLFDMESEIRRAGLAPDHPLQAEGPVERRKLRLKGEARQAALKFAVAAVLSVAALVGGLPLVEGGAVKSQTSLDSAPLLLERIVGSLVPGLFELDPDWLRLGLLGLTVPTLSWCGGGFFAHALRCLKVRVADESTLLALALGAAFLYSVAVTLALLVFPELDAGHDVYYGSINSAVAIILLGSWLEARSRVELSDYVGRWQQLAPKVATVQRGGVDADVPVQEVIPGDLVLVRPNQTIPVDGVIIEGSSAVDESMLTGEREPIKKQAGDPVFAGTANGAGSLVLEARGVGPHAMLAQAASFLDEFELGGSKLQRLVERIGSVLPAILIAAALGSFAAWVLMGSSHPVAFATLALASALMIARPSLLSWAAPTATLAGAGRGAEHGVLLRGSGVVEAVPKLDTLVLQKTGTITVGSPTVTHVLGARRSDGSVVPAGDLLRLAASVEARSDHRVARAVVQAARAKGVELVPVERFVSMPGRGVRGIVGKYLVEVISVRHARERSLDLGTLAPEVNGHALRGRSSVVVVVNDTVQGVMVIADPVKLEAKEAIARLKEMGLRLYLLSGEARQVATLLAKDIGLPHVISEVAPADKVHEILRLRQEGRKVGVVGDGIEDAGALGAADVGFAIGVGGEIERKASDVTLLRGDLRAVVAAVELCRQIKRRARANLLGATAYHLIGIPLAVGVFYPWTGWLMGLVPAAAAASLAGLVILQSSLGLKRFRFSAAAS